MNDALMKYITQAYSRDVLGKRGAVVEMPLDQEAIKQARVELTRIDGMGLGANLAQRDFTMYQRKKALEALLTEADGGSNASEAGTGGSAAGDAPIQGGEAPLGIQEGSGGDRPQAGDSDQPQGSGT